MSLTLLLQNFRSPVLDIIAGIFSLPGNETIFLCVLGIIYWCLNKRVAYRIAFSYILAGPVFYMVRGFAHVPRPWVRNSAITPPALAAKGAFGYSMPSAHTLHVSTLAARFITNSRMLIAGIVAVIATVLTALSRIYLGLNTWLDALISVIIAVAAVIVADYILNNLSLDPSGNRIYALVIAIPTVLMLGITLSLYAAGTIDKENLATAVNSAGIYLGLIGAWFLDSAFTHFPEKCDFAWQQVLKAIIGIIILLVFKDTLALLLNVIAPDFIIGKFFCNLLAVLIAFGLYPILIKRFFAARFT